MAEEYEIPGEADELLCKQVGAGIPLESRRPPQLGIGAPGRRCSGVDPPPPGWPCKEGGGREWPREPAVRADVPQAGSEDLPTFYQTQSWRHHRAWGRVAREAKAQTRKGVWCQRQESGPGVAQRSPGERSQSTEWNWQRGSGMTSVNGGSRPQGMVSCRQCPSLVHF